MDDTLHPDEYVAGNIVPVRRVGEPDVVNEEQMKEGSDADNAQPGNALTVGPLTYSVDNRGLCWQEETLFDTCERPIAAPV